MITNGVEDPEEIMRAKIQSQVDTFVAKAELSFSEIKNNFNTASDAAKSTDDLDKALNIASNTSNNVISGIVKSME